MHVEGFILTPDFLTDQEESALLELFRTIAFGEVRMHGVTARRHVAQFGWRYAFESHQLTPAADLPLALHPIRQRAAELAGIAPADFAETLLTEYPPGAGIGWHRDAPAFGIVAGVSLASPCRMRFQRGTGPDRETATIDLPSRSMYLLTGPARTQWQHSIPAVRHLRYSVTFRTLRRNAGLRPAFTPRTGA